MRRQRAHRILDLLVDVQRRALRGCFHTLKRMHVPMMRHGKLAVDLGPERSAGIGPSQIPEPHDTVTAASDDPPTGTLCRRAQIPICTHAQSIRAIQTRVTRRLIDTWLERDVRDMLAKLSRVEGLENGACAEIKRQDGRGGYR